MTSSGHIVSLILIISQFLFIKTCSFTFDPDELIDLVDITEPHFVVEEVLQVR